MMVDCRRYNLLLVKKRLIACWAVSRNMDGHEPKVSPDRVMLTLNGLTLGHLFGDNRAIKGHGLDGDLLLEDLLSQISPIALWDKAAQFFPAAL